MKKLIIMFALLTPGAGLASDFCEDIHFIAENAMKNRQIGVPLHETRGMFRAILSEPTMQDVADLIVIQAYQIRRMSAESNRHRMVQDFANDQATACVVATR